MAQVVKTGVYEILTRFNCEIGEAWDQPRGSHVIEQACLVDEDTGKIVGKVDTGAASHAKAADHASVKKLIGAQSAKFLADHKRMQDAHDEAHATARKHREDKEAHANELHGKRAALEAAQAEIEQLKQGVGALRDQLAEKEAELLAEKKIGGTLYTELDDIKKALKANGIIFERKPAA